MGCAAELLIVTQYTSPLVLATSFVCRLAELVPFLSLPAI